MIQYSFIKPGDSIGTEIYCNQLDQMMKNLSEKQPCLANRDQPILLHDNARPHTEKITQLKILELNLETIDHPSYSPELTPTDNYLFRNLDNFLKGKKFTSQHAKQNAFHEFIDSCSPGFYAKGINMLSLKWKKCVD